MQPVTHVPAGATGRRERGQTLVEFALVFPIFIVLFFGMIEFGFIFNGNLSLNYATRDAALAAAEAGNNANADCLILQQIDQDLNAPTDEASIQTVRIFSADQTGHPVAGIEQVYIRGGTFDCGGGPITVPYSQVGTATYPYTVRCSDIDRTTCSPNTTSATNTGVDIIGVQIDFTYRYVTPLGSVISLVGGHTTLWGGPTMTMTAANAMRMEPVL